MKTDSKAIILFDSRYINLSEKLRNELELEIDKLQTQDRFNLYVNQKVAGIENANKSDFICTYLLSKAPKEYALSGELLQGIKTWFNMHNADRLLVIDKFRKCYQSVIAPENSNENPVVTVIFCEFLMSKLLGILAESRWHNLVHHTTNYRQMLYN